MSASSVPAPATLTTADGDTACLSYQPLDPQAIEASVRSAKSGAVVSFVGYTRDNFQGRQVTQLVYESYVPLALKTLGQILEEARNLPTPPPLEGSVQQCCARPRAISNDSFMSEPEPRSAPAPKIDINRIHVAHLLGPSPPLTPSIVITVASPHRREAFWLTEWLLERVKERVQVWKREYYEEEGSVAGVSPFVGKDGEGPDGRGGRERQSRESEPRIKMNNQRPAPGEGGSKWKANFDPSSVVRLDA